MTKAAILPSNHLPESGVPVLAYWQSLGNYKVRGVICGVYKDGTWFERIEFANNETGEPEFVAIDPTCYEIYNWLPLPDAPAQEVTL